MEILTIKRRSSGKHDPEDIYGGSPDADYMRRCREVDLNPPATWEKYDANTPAGVRKIIEMEYRELMDAKTPESTETNICHLSVALLRLWRLHHDTNAHGTGN